MVDSASAAVAAGLDTKSNTVMANLKLESTLDSFYTGGIVQTSPCGQFLFTACDDCVNVIDLTDGRVKHSIGKQDRDQVNNLEGASSSVQALAACVQPINSLQIHLVVAYSNLLLKHYTLDYEHKEGEDGEGERKMQQTQTRRLKTPLLVRVWRSQHKNVVTRLCFTDDGSMVASASTDCTVKLWHMSMQYCTHTLKTTSVICSLLFDTRGEYLCAGTLLGQIFRWNLLSEASNREVQTLSGHSSAVTSLSHHADNVHMISASRDQTMCIWKADHDVMKEYSKYRTYPLYEPVETMVPAMLIPDLPELEGKTKTLDLNHVYMSAGAHGSVTLWNVMTGRKLFEKSMIDHDESVQSETKAEDTEGATVANHNALSCINQILVNKQSRQYVMSTADHLILVANAYSLKVHTQLVGTNDEIHDAMFCGSAKEYVCVASNSAQLRVYDRQSLNCTLGYGHTDMLLCVNGTGAGSLLASGSKDNTMRIWNVNAKHTSQHTAQVHVWPVAVASGHTSSVSSVVWSRVLRADKRCPTFDSAFICTASYDKTVKLWPLGELNVEDTSDRRTAAKQPKLDKKSDVIQTLVSSSTVVAHTDDITCVSIAPNNLLLATGSLDKTVKLWAIQSKYADYDKMKNTATFTLTEAALIGGQHKRGVWDVQFSPTDQVLLTASGDCHIRIFALSDRSCVRSFEGHVSPVVKLCCLPNGIQFLSSDSSGLLKLWNIKNSECVKTFEAHDAKIWALDYDQSTSCLVTGGSDACVKFWVDCTQDDALEVHTKRTEEHAHDQQLSNLMQQKQFKKAFDLALQLNRPRGALRAVQGLLIDQTDTKVLIDVIRHLSTEKLEVLIDYVTQWNTNVKTCEVAQDVLSNILKTHSLEDLLDLPSAGKRIEELLVYTERHFDRFTRLKQNAAFLQFMCKNTD